MNLGKGLWVLCPVNLDLYLRKQLTITHLQFSQNENPGVDSKNRQKKSKKEALTENMVKLTYFIRNARTAQGAE